MPFQQISLDQSIYKKPQKSPVSQALRPQAQQQRGGFNAAGGNEPNSFVERQKAEWAAEDKAKKAERDMQMQKLQEVGMQTVKQAQQQQQQAQEQQAEIKQKVEENPEPFAEEQWKFFLLLDEEGQKRFTDQIFAPSPQQSNINGQPVPNAKTKYAGGVIADYWIKKGYVMFDPEGNVVVNKPAPEEEWYASGNYVYNRKTGETQVVEGGGEQRATSLNELGNYKNQALNADTIEEKDAIVNEYNKYSESIPIEVTDKEWETAQLSYLDTVKSSIDTLVDEKGWLQKGVKTSDEVGLDFKGEQQVSVIYKRLYDEYSKYLKMLEDRKVDVSGYPKIKPLNKIERVGGMEGFKTWGGVSKGDFKSIYE